MRKRLARFLLLFAALVLPLQAPAAVNMQLPVLGGMQQIATDTAAAATATAECHHADGAADTGQAQDAGCKVCGVCHLAASGYVPTAEVRTGIAPAGEVLQPRPVAALHSHVPEPPQYPPKRSARQ